MELVQGVDVGEEECEGVLRHRVLLGHLVSKPLNRIDIFIYGFSKNLVFEPLTRFITSRSFLYVLSVMRISFAMKYALSVG